MMARNWLSATAIMALGPGPKAAPGEGYCISATTAAIKSPCTHRNHERCLDVQTGRASRKFPRNLGLKITNRSSVGISWITSVCSVYSLRPVLAILSQRHHNTEFASVENDTKRVQSALCTRLRIVLSRIRLELKTSV